MSKRSNSHEPRGGSLQTPFRAARALLVALFVSGAWPGCLEMKQTATIEGVCANGECEPLETPDNCPTDCPLGVCGNHLCEFGENSTICPEDCGKNRCGDGQCDADENPKSCPEDCPWGRCGNQVCEAEDMHEGCASDCFLDHCGDGICDSAETVSNCPSDCWDTARVDILFVLDDAQGSDRIQHLLADATASLAKSLLLASAPALSIHFGVVTMDLGTGPYAAGPCAGQGDRGFLGLAGGRNVALECTGYSENFWTDDPPAGCVVTRLPDGRCATTTCTQENCGATTTLVTDSDTNCPRCTTNGETSRQILSCLVNVGAQGCPYRQGMEAMRLALEDLNHNVGFLRSDSLLVVVFFTETDDCSAAAPSALFDPDRTDLGPMTPYRCTRYGLVCSNGLDEPGTKQACRPAGPGETDLLYSLDRYLDFLRELRDPGRLLLASVDGGAPSEVQIESSSQGLLLDPSCEDPQETWSAKPAFRIRWLVDQFSPQAKPWAHETVCAQDLQPFVQALTNEILRRMER